MADFFDLLNKSGAAVAPFYFVLGGIHLAAHLLWDWLSEETDPMSLGDLQYKTDALFSAATFASNAYLILVLWQGTWSSLGSELVLPLVIASSSGLMVSFAALQPYKPAGSRGRSRRGDSISPG